MDRALGAYIAGSPRGCVNSQVGIGAYFTETDADCEASSLSRIGAAIGTYLVPQALSHIGVGPTMIIAAVITLVGAGVSVAWAPETRGLTLGESAALGGKTAARSSVAA